jgi:hypothetical protein
MAFARRTLSAASSRFFTFDVSAQVRRVSLKKGELQTHSQPFLTPGENTMFRIKSTLLASALTLACLTTWAQSAPNPAATPGIDQRQANQEKRVDQGVASGALTPREAKRMENQQAAVDRAEDKAKADGVVTAQERKRLHKAQNHTSRHIHRQKHDAQTAPKP